LLATTLLISSISLFAQTKPAYEIRVKLNGYQGEKLFLGNYFGDKEYLKDSVVINKKGWAVFTGTEPLPCGIYSIINQERNMRILEFIVSTEDQTFSMEGNYDSPVATLEVKDSEDNILFSDYQKYMVKNGKRRQELGKLYMDVKNRNQDSTNLLKEELERMDADYEAYRNGIIEGHPKTLTARILKSLIDIDVPEPPLNPDGSVDSLFQYRYYKQHYWDNVDFTEDCMVRTPFFHNKLERYMTKLVLQYPDSINAEADRLVAMAKGKKELYHYIVWWITMTYERSQFMCMDAIPVHMWKNYYQWPDAWWVDTTTMTRIREREKVMGPLCCNRIAPNLIMKDTAHKYRSMHAIQAKYTVLVFWDPDCSHCKKEIPVIKKMYDSLHSYGVEVYAVGVEQEYDKWKSFIIDNNLNWINVIDIYNETNFRSIYDINSTPIIYLLDKDKK
ncbi:MAG: DUF5106 domain-containing protein, partial [Bacteroidota bacterium]|nr:DUF5106 domain-containing protein [Bacteroidota bacterium]MDX5431027.1 DUF5106 domain-containing protein [Bacteroidota bacterium]